jgi:predicted Rossmann fold nucleotide-binding protein DprA/Smf involved in DNA uptake
MTQTFDATRTVIIALTTSLGLAPAERQLVAPLTPSEWNRLSVQLGRQSLPIDTLLLTSPIELLTLTGGDEALASRIAMLLERIEAAKDAVRDLDNRRIWVLTNAEAGYPELWRTRLGASAPPVLFGVGNQELLEKRSIGIVGSRDISAELSEVANDLGATAAYEPFVVVSGGARGTDRIGLTGALEVDGSVVAVVPDHLQRDRLRRQNHDDIARGRLTMVSVVHPDSAFSVGNAMYRNRLIYALSTLTIVVATSGDGGGTWAGATANLKQRWVPLAVWTGQHAPSANQRLVELGGYGFDTIPKSRAEMGTLIQAATDRFVATAPLAVPAQLGMPGFPI